jgi:hypothetical protein
MAYSSDVGLFGSDGLGFQRAPAPDVHWTEASPGVVFVCGNADSLDCGHSAAMRSGSCFGHLPPDCGRAFHCRAGQAERGPPRLSGLHSTGLRLAVVRIIVRGCFARRPGGRDLGSITARVDRWISGCDGLFDRYLIIPAFCGARILFSLKSMFLSLVLLKPGCLARVLLEITQYEGHVNGAWAVVPWSAMIEFPAVSIFAVNLEITLMPPTAHLMRAATAKA